MARFFTITVAQKFTAMWLTFSLTFTLNQNSQVKGEIMSKKSERFILKLEIKIQELSVKYNNLSPIEKLEVEQYLKTKFQGSMIDAMLDYMRKPSK